MKQSAASLLFVAILLGSEPRTLTAIEEGPCSCRDGMFHAQVRAQVESREVINSLEETLTKARIQATLRGIFSLAFCAPLPGGFEARSDRELRWPASGCSARSPGPRPWPELLRLECEREPVLPPWPEGFSETQPAQWEVSGEELNRVWRTSLEIARAHPSCRSKTQEEKQMSGKDS